MLTKVLCSVGAVALTLTLAVAPSEAVVYSFSGSACRPEAGGANPATSASFGGWAATGVNAMVCPITGIESSSQDITSFLVTVTDNSSSANFGCELKIMTTTGAAYSSAVRSNAGTGTMSISLANPVNGGAIVNNIAAYNLRCSTPAGGYIRGYNVAQVNP